MGSHMLPLLLVASLCLFTTQVTANETPFLNHVAPISTRQSLTCTFEQLQALSDSLPGDCPTDLFGFPVTLLLDGAVTPEYVERFCEPRCSTPVVNYYRMCISEVGENTAQSFVQVCAMNTNGDKCYSSVVTQSLQSSTLACTSLSTCSATCKSAVQTAIEVAGCCVNIIDSSVVAGLSLACDTETPDLCRVNGSGVQAALNITAMAMCLITALVELLM